jgi:hypothetical protein
MTLRRVIDQVRNRNSGCSASTSARLSENLRWVEIDDRLVKWSTSVITRVAEPPGAYFWKA